MPVVSTLVTQKRTVTSGTLLRSTEGLREVETRDGAPVAMGPQYDKPS